MAKVNSIDGAVIWSDSYGGSSTDQIYSLQQTQEPNASIIAAGGTYSNDYNVSGNHGLGDLWMVTIDGNSGILVSANCYGGSYDEGWRSIDPALSLQTTVDGGYLLTTYSYSNDGDVSGFPDNIFSPDFWILKFNRGKTIDWQLSAGGSNQDLPFACVAANNGGYLISGYTTSNDFDVKGFNGGFDGWVLKLSNCFVPPVSTATITANGPACGGNVSLSVPGGIGYSYQWKRNGSNVTNVFFNNYFATTPGTYTCTVSNGACGIINSPNSILSKKSVATISPSGTVNKCAADNVNFTANTGTGLTYQWYKGNVTIAGAVNSTYTTKKPGKYKVVVTNTVTQCTKTSPATTVNNTCKESIASTDESNALTLSAALLEQNIPNPFSSNSVIHYNLPKKCSSAYIVFTDMVGRTVKQFTLSSAGKGSINITAGLLAQGTYTYALYVDGKLIDSKRLVINK